MPFWSRNSNYSLLLVRERLSLSAGLFLNVATTVFSVCNLSRNRCHLTRVLSKEKGLFQEFPVFTGISVLGSLSAQGHLWLMAVRLVTLCPTRAGAAGKSSTFWSAGWTTAAREGTVRKNPLSQKQRAALRSGGGFSPRPTRVKPAWLCCVDISTTVECVSRLWFVSASYRLSHAKPSRLSGNTSANSSFVLHWQVLLNWN